MRRTLMARFLTRPAWSVLTALLLMLSSIAADAGERNCREVPQLRSKNSNVASRITFVNTSGMYRSIDWIDFDGQSKSYGGLNPGESRTQETFATHVWVVSTGPGDCLQVFVAETRPLTAQLPRMPVDGPRPAATPQAGTPKQTACAANYVLVKGACVPAQNCGANAFRNREGDCDCRKHFTMRDGQCISTAQTCKSTEVYSSSIAGCVPVAGTCGTSEIFDARRNACIPRASAPKRCPAKHYINQNGVCQPDETGG